jgi:signal transduction histidine kinase
MYQAPQPQGVGAGPLDSVTGPGGSPLQPQLVPGARGIAVPERDLRHLLAWFVRIRWLFVAGLGAAVLAGSLAFRLEFAVRETLAVAAVVATYNVFFAAYHRFGHPGSGATGRAEAGLQIGLDLVALTTLIHFVGGPGSPLVSLYLIHAIAGVLLLPKRESWLIGAGIFGLFLALVALELAEGGPRHRLGALAATAGSRATVEVVLGLTLLVTLGASMTITSAIMNGLRLRERQLQEAYASLSEKQMQLVQTEKHASLGRLVAGIAHEINNPIQFIHGNMTFLTEAFTEALPLLDAHRAVHPELRLARLDYPVFRRQVPVLLRDMADGAERIGEIVRELRTFARRDPGPLDEEVDLGEVVRSSVRLLHNQLKHFRVEEDLAADLPLLRGNVAQLQQVVVNTLQNAFQALPGDGTGRIAIRARVEQGGAQVRLSIEDNGAGIPPEIRDRIFDPFFTTKQSSGGTGLGLSIIEGIIQQHGGQIELESQVGKGTVFHFILSVKGRVAA